MIGRKEHHPAEVIEFTRRTLSLISLIQMILSLPFIMMMMNFWNYARQQDDTNTTATFVEEYKVIVLTVFGSDLDEIVSHLSWIIGDILAGNNISSIVSKENPMYVCGTLCQEY